MGLALQYEKLMLVLWSELRNLGYLHLTSDCSSPALIPFSSYYMTFAIRESNIIHACLIARG